MEAVLARAREESRGHPGATPSRIRIHVGEFALASRESLEMAFRILVRGTELEDALLEMEEVPGQAKCEICGFSGAPGDLGLEDGPLVPLICPSCGSPLVVTVGGGVALAEIQFQDRRGRESEDTHRGRG